MWTQAKFTHDKQMSRDPRWSGKQMKQSDFNNNNNNKTMAALSKFLEKKGAEQSQRTSASFCNFGHL